MSSGTDFNYKDFLKRHKEWLDSIENAYITFAGGKNVTGRVVCHYDCPNTGLDYILFTDDTKNYLGQYRVFAVSINPITGAKLYGDAMTDQEVDLINDIIKKNLSTGLFNRKAIVRLYFDSIEDVHFD